jgi:hypothetical protein
MSVDNNTITSFWTLNVVDEDNFAIQRFKNHKHASVFAENDYYQMICVSYGKRGICTVNGKHIEMYDAHRSEYRYYLVDKEEKAIVMKCHWGRKALKSDNVDKMFDIMERRAQEKIDRIDKILLEE